MQDKLNRGALVALVASLLATPVMAEPMSDDAAMQLLQRVNDLEREISGLRGENEKLRNDLDNVQKDQKTALEQVDERMEKLKTPPADSTTSTNSTSGDSNGSSLNSSTSSPSSESESKTDSSKTDSSSLSSDKDKTTDSNVKKDDPSGFYSYGTGKTDDKNPTTDGKSEEKPDPSKLDTPKTDDSKSSSSTDKAADKTDAPSSESKTDSKTTGKLPEREERSAYDEAFQTLLKEPKDSIPMFRTFLKDYPSSSLAPSAQYWIGEALYADKDFKGAIEEFLTVLKDHKGSDKAPDAALKLGYSFYELGEWEKARKTLEDVISFFPDNAETAQKAKDRLEKMKGEGH